MYAYGSQCLSLPAWWLRRFPPGSSSRQRGSERTVPGCGIDTGVGQIGQVLEFNQLQAEGADHGPEAVNDEKHQLLLAVYLYSSIWIS